MRIEKKMFYIVVVVGFYLVMFFNNHFVYERELEQFSKVQNTNTIKPNCDETPLIPFFRSLNRNIFLVISG